MATSEVLYRFALLDDSRQTVCIDDIEPSFTLGHKFHCPHCRNEMYATFGPDYAHHFRHKGAKCQQSKYLHSLAEYVFYEEYTKCLDSNLPFFLKYRVQVPCNNACVLKKHVNCREHYIDKKVDLTQEYSLLSLEQRVDVGEHYRIPDILLESIDGKQLWIEFWVSHETEEEKRRDGCIIEIKVETEKDLEKIRRHEIIQSEGEDQSVRLFNVKDNESSSLFVDDEKDDLPVGYPCEQYFCYEIMYGQVQYGIIESPKKDIEPCVTYQIILRLNWRRSYKSSEGDIGSQTTEKNLEAVCRQKYFSYLGGTFFQDHAYDSLIISEWRKEQSLSMMGRASAYLYPPSNENAYQHVLTQQDSSFDPSSVEWVDLGLPSGVLWSKNDIGEELTFRRANEAYGEYVPSEEDAEELRTFCDRRWDGNALVLTGLNGNSISIACKESHKSFWLNSLDRIDNSCGHCFHIVPPEQILINDADIYSALFVRLVKR